MKRIEVCLFLFVVMFSSFVHANESDEVLIDYIPDRLTDAKVVEIVKHAFMGRKWNVVASDANSVSGELTKYNIFAKVKIYREGGAIKLSDYSETPDYPDAYSREYVKTKSTEAPRRWINNLKLDITKGISQAEIKH